MRPLARHLVTLLALGALLLAVAAAAFWVRGYWRHDALVARRGLRVFAVESLRGELAFHWYTDASAAVAAMRPIAPPGGFARHSGSLAGTPRVRASLSSGARHRTLGVAYDAYDRVHSFAVPGGGNATTRERLLVVPNWLPTSVLALLPAAVAAHRLRARRLLRPGACPGCGYDLRASPDRCPECGRPCASGVSRG